MNRLSLWLSLGCLVAVAACDKKVLPPSTSAPVAVTTAAAPVATGNEVTLPTGAPGEPPAIPLGTKLHCPVGGEDFTVKANTMQVIYKGKRVAFCCPDCYPDFKKDPAKYPLTM